MNMLVSEILSRKPRGLITASPRDTVEAAMSLMMSKNIHCLMVYEDQKMIGIVSDRDYAHKIVARGLDAKTTLIQDIMTRQVITISPGATLRDCMKIMSEKRFRHLPVEDDGVIVGMISMTDVVREAMAAASTDEEWEI